MWVPKGSFLNSRWIPLGWRSAEWELITTLDEQVLKEKFFIVRIEEDGEVTWYRLIYEVVSSRSQLLRQRVHIRAQQDRERVFKHALLGAVEREFVKHATEMARLNSAQFSELSTLSRRLSNRLGSLTVVQAQLSGRDTIAFLDAWMEIEGLRSHRDRLSQVLNELPNAAKRRNFDVYLGNVADRLAVYISPEIRRPVYWSRYHVSRTIVADQQGDVRGCQSHLLRSVHHLDVAIKVLRDWSESLPDEERRFIPQF
jgi:hypothetical protein